MRCSSPAAQRNKQPIADVLTRLLRAINPGRGARVLEIASGSGEHVAHFASVMPDCTFLPSDPSSDARASIADHLASTPLPNVEPPRDIDVLVPGWHEAVDAVLCINMIHIAPWQATIALVQGARACLRPEGLLLLYGPYRFHGAFLAPSNEDFSSALRARDPSWGVRDIDDVDDVAQREGFVRDDLIPLPANNHIVVYRYRPSLVTT